jgi:hypothetical protein
MCVKGNVSVGPDLDKYTVICQNMLKNPCLSLTLTIKYINGLTICFSDNASILFFSTSLRIPSEERQQLKHDWSEIEICQGNILKYYILVTWI